MTVALLVAYDGTDLHGFARQKGEVRTVQGLLEERLSLLLRRGVDLVGAGRTDAGVHASGQVVSFEAPGVEPSWLQMRLNRWLAPEVVVRAAARVPDDFSARFSAQRRAYEYRAYRSPAADPFRDRFALHLPEDVRLTPMREGARAFVGEHDFASFCRKGPGHSVRRVRSLRITAAAEELVVSIEADAFCHQMVRSIVGLLLDIGKGKRPPAAVGEALEARSRAAAGPVAPARGLHLVKVTYRPDPFGGAS